MKPLATLVCFATGAVYEKYAEAVRRGAAEFFFPGRSQYLQLQTTPSWPYASRDRYMHMLANRRKIRGDYVFLLDADSRFEGFVDDEVLSDGITVTSHAAFPPSMPPDRLDYDRNPDSTAYVPMGEGRRYYPGAFLGGPRDQWFALCQQIVDMTAADGDYVPAWYDESYLNRILIDQPPALELDERYCAWFNKRIPDARIRALNKTDAEYRWRDNQRAAEAVHNGRRA